MGTEQELEKLGAHELVADAGDVGPDEAGAGEEALAPATGGGGDVLVLRCQTPIAFTAKAPTTA